MSATSLTALTPRLESNVCGQKTPVVKAVNYESKLRKPTANITKPEPAAGGEESRPHNPTPTYSEPVRSNSTQPTLASSRARKRCTCQSKHDIELKVSDEAVQRCHRMLREIIKLNGDRHGKFYLAEMLNKVQTGPRATPEYSTPQVTLQESLSALDQYIRNKVGKAFIKRVPKPEVTEEKKVRRTRAARHHFDGESSISLESRDFSTPE
jgi:hypothetical protein